ncbi:MAG: mitochondrial carrier domain-containing protein [Olpidium bornovanus]|uniref:Mitochondrial carrier domain-containing protein n=1 Tax=Olpidium bornovanus TaxID=278681 RepID=A0A8H7ZYJ3_9FUNG|nr:MAG: mitochondrial carrier domain-containing protein [Olpidium bornovanus]
MPYHGTALATGTLQRVGRANGWCCRAELDLVRLVWRNPALSRPATHIPPISHVLSAGFGAGVACFMASTPTEMIKCRLQVQARKVDRTSTHKPASAWRAQWDIIRRGGLRGLYTGGWITICRDAPGYMVYFGVYESLVRLSVRVLPPERAEPNVPPAIGWKDTLTYITAGGFAGVAIRTNAFAMAREMYRTEGLRVFTQGLAPTMLRAFPVNAVTFMVFEAVKTI